MTLSTFEIKYRLQKEDHLPGTTIRNKTKQAWQGNQTAKGHQ